MLFKLVTQNSLLCGDFNAFHPAWGSILAPHRGNQIYDTINSLGLCLLNDGSPTHVGRLSSTNSAIDLYFCSPDLACKLSRNTLCEAHGSDHFPITIKTNFPNLTHLISNPGSIQNMPIHFNFNKTDWELFSLHIQNSFSSLPNDPNLLISYTAFTNIIDNVAKSTIPSSRPDKKSFPSTPPWWNSTCNNSVKNRSSLFRIFCRTGSMSDFLSYSNACFLTTRTLKNEKRNSWKRFCSNLKSFYSIQNLWFTARHFKNCVIPPPCDQITMIGSRVSALKLRHVMSLTNIKFSLVILLQFVSIMFLLIISIYQNYN
uniref:Endonuclease/exonuclease/phosphatase domain-containing protein n=1 Tax=Sipha flava TaxID=143950 RepID=A0A2S2Q9W9_9HEMI